MDGTLEDAVRELLGALVDDAGARELRALVRGGAATLVVTRPGRRETLEVSAPPLSLEGPARLRLGALEVSLAPRGPGARLFARRLASPAEELRALVEEGALPPGLDEAIWTDENAPKPLPPMYAGERKVPVHEKDTEGIAHGASSVVDGGSSTRPIQ